MQTLESQNRVHQVLGLDEGFQAMHHGAVVVLCHHILRQPEHPVSGLVADWRCSQSSRMMICANRDILLIDRYESVITIEAAWSAPSAFVSCPFSAVSTPISAMEALL